MELFKSGNPALKESTFQNTIVTDLTQVMTVRGTLNKFGFLFLMVMATAFYSWKEFAEGGNVQPLMLSGAIGGLVVALVITMQTNGQNTCKV